MTAYRERRDIAARERLIEMYLPLVESLAQRYVGRGEDREDLVQVGSIGLINAIDRFDPKRGDELAAYAVPNIEGEIRRHLRDRATTIRLPRVVEELRAPLARARVELTARHGREPSVGELARELGVTEAHVSRALEAREAGSPLALGAGGLEVGAPGELEAAEDRVLLSGAFRGLSNDERRVLYLRYVRDLGPESAAAELGISQRQLSRRTAAALAKVRAALERGPERLPSRDPGHTMPVMRAARTPAPDRYLDRPYRISISRDGEADSGAAWLAQVEELQGCEARGASADEAAAAVQIAMEEWISAALAEGREVPEPRGASSHSGKLLLRMPQSLHAELARAAERDEVSLNQFITSALSSAVGWRQGGAGASEPRTPPEQERRLALAMAANLAVVAIAGIAAIVLLVIALSGGF
ncbi:MAG: sigma-70 family RNA polymerase sigma factor [Thermoleophilaceae bacterium]